MWNGNLFNRTFGLELEFANVDKKQVKLPAGYSWSKEEVVINTDGSNGTFAAQFGGEVNTPPLSFCQKDREALRSVFESLILFGGKLTWTKAIHIHIYAGDFELQSLKNIFLLSYYTASHIKRIGDVGEWNEQPWQCPSPTIEYVQKVRDAKTLQEFFNAFANSMNKGYIRHIINVPSFFKRKTVEFRLFNPTYKFEEVENSILFSYKFLRYALTHTEDDFKQLGSFDDFVKELKVNYVLPKKVEPLLFSGLQTSAHECFVAKAVSLSTKMVKILSEQCGETLATINPNLFSLELKMYTKTKLTIYNADELNDIIYKIVKGDLRIVFGDKFSFLNDFQDGSTEMQITSLLIFHRIHKFTADNDFARMELDSYIDRIDESIERIMPTALELVTLFDNCEYIIGTVEDAIQCEPSIFFQYDHMPKSRSTVSALRKHSDYSLKLEVLKTDYYELFERVPKETNFMFVSLNHLFSYNKIGKSGKQIFYTSQKASAKIEQKADKYKLINIDTPPDNLEIVDPEKLRIIQVKPSEFMQIQKLYIKKVHKVKITVFAFVVMYDKYCLGGFGFDWPKDQDYDIWLLSDLATNNNIPRIAKFILLCIQSKQVKKELQRKIRMEINCLYTNVYTTNPVSMKYRGTFDKVKSDEPSTSLKYESKFGVMLDNKHIIETYSKMIARK